ncbi:nicotinate (nicotinamide) nucleotide adenylyltransferase [Litorivicinus lipolyticus]|uniref:Probable nicotinate-nucleotide adenylyltransferase n=1 Tax=Litorivicinus lipolyticus TaxID=418701 RepID=A0A5Q2QJ10_9GAMM|nr:nicotinate (nicotinamide) nucleotide adenylyltransferase [Litorivicinus lipolyticus]
MGSLGRGSDAALRALLGGTFDPVTRGHLAAARAVRDALGCSVELIPNRQSPLKGRPGDDHHRLAMLALACRDQSGIDVNPVELSLPQPSYTVRTLAHLARENVDTLVFCLGTDALATIERWHAYPQLIELAGIVVLSRPGFELPAPPNAWRGRLATLDEFKQSPKGRWTHLPFAAVDSASSRVRHARANGGDWQTWVTESVADYIKEHGLYE